MWSLTTKLLSLGPRGWQDVLRAQTALLRARRLVDREPIGALAIREPVGSEPLRGDPARARALGIAVQRTAAHGVVRAPCLVRAIALRDLLLAEGIVGSSIRIGVRRREGVFEAHAWVRWGDMILGDHPEHVAQFTEVDDLRVLGHQ